MSLSGKGMVELRALAQAAKINFSFSDTKEDLIYKLEYNIKASEKEIKPEPLIIPDKVINRSQRVIKNKEEIPIVLQPLIDRGLKINITDSEFSFRLKEKDDSGNLNQPLKNIIRCAERLFNTTN